MTDLDATIERLRTECQIGMRNFGLATRWSREAMAVINALVAERDRLQKSLMEAGIRAGELQGKLVDAERERDDLRRRVEP